MKKTSREKYTCMDCKHRERVDVGKPKPIEIKGETLYIQAAQPYCTLGHTEPEGEDCKDFEHYLKEKRQRQLIVNTKRYLKDT